MRGFLGPPLHCLEPDTVPAPMPRQLPASCSGRDTPLPSPLSSGDLPPHLGPSRSRRLCVSFSARAPPLAPPRPSSPRPAHPAAAPPPARLRPPSSGLGIPPLGPLRPWGDGAALFLGSSWTGCRCCISPQGSISLFPIFLFLTHFLFYSLRSKPYLFCIYLVLGLKTSSLSPDPWPVGGPLDPLQVFSRESAG